MRVRKLMYDSFFVNNENFSGVTSVDSLTSDLYFHFTDIYTDKLKLSGNTFANASGIVVENSFTTSIVVTPSSITGSTGGSRQLAVVNQNALNVISECAFSATTSLSTVSAGGLITFGAITGNTSVVVTHPDIPLIPTTVPVYIYWTGGLTLTSGNTLSGFTGTTSQEQVVMTTGGYDVTNVVSWLSSVPSRVTVGLHTGLITFVSAGAPVIVTATYPTGATISLNVTVFAS